MKANGYDEFFATYPQADRAHLYALAFTMIENIIREDGNHAEKYERIVEVIHAAKKVSNKTLYTERTRGIVH